MSLVIIEYDLLLRLTSYILVSPFDNLFFIVIIVKLSVPPNIVDEASSADTLATEGMRVTLSCHAEGNPTPIITWRREDRGEIKICTEDDSFR